MRPSALLAALVVMAVSAFTAVAVLPAGASQTYTVEPGDTLSQLAEDFGVSVSELAQANGLDTPNDLHAGQILTVPGRGRLSHVVAGGESLSGIAAKYGGSVAGLVRLNKLADPESLDVGQELQVPGPLVGEYPNIPDSIKTNSERAALVEIFEGWAYEYDVPVDLLMAISYQESGWQAEVRSHKGAIGVGQLMPDTASWVASHLLKTPDLDPNNPQDNIQMSARFLAWLIAISPNERAAIAGYYQGPSSVAQQGLFDDTEDYVANVQAARNLFVQA